MLDDGHDLELGGLRTRRRARGAVDPNYTITYVPGSVTVSPVVWRRPRHRLDGSRPSASLGNTGVPSVSTSPGLALTGALLSVEWLIGMAALLLGTGLVVVARWRRRTPRHAST